MLSFRAHKSHPPDQMDRCHRGGIIGRTGYPLEHNHPRAHLEDYLLLSVVA